MKASEREKLQSAEDVLLIKAVRKYIKENVPFDTAANLSVSLVRSNGMVPCDRLEFTNKINGRLIKLSKGHAVSSYDGREHTMETAFDITKDIETWYKSDESIKKILNRNNNLHDILKKDIIPAVQKSAAKKKKKSGGEAVTSGTREVRTFQHLMGIKVAKCIRMDDYSKALKLMHEIKTAMHMSEYKKYKSDLRYAYDTLNDYVKEKTGNYEENYGEDGEYNSPVMEDSDDIQICH